MSKKINQKWLEQTFNQQITNQKAKTNKHLQQV